MEELFTLNEARAFLKVSDATIRRYIRDGKLKSRKFGRQYRFTEMDIKEFLGLQSTGGYEVNNDERQQSK